MTITVQATYENGVLKPAQPLPLNEREQVQVTIQRPAGGADRTFGMIGWTGDADAFERLFQESEAKRSEDV
jgi:predicted DNA-binding antitoxin AbrB/MazE fold protein